MGEGASPVAASCTCSFASWSLAWLSLKRSPAARARSSALRRPCMLALCHHMPVRAMSSATATPATTAPPAVGAAQRALACYACAQRPAARTRECPTAPTRQLGQIATGRPRPPPATRLPSALRGACLVPAVRRMSARPSVTHPSCGCGEEERREAGATLGDVTAARRCAPAAGRRR